jgi:hypothetical protein
LDAPYLKEGFMDVGAFLISEAKPSGLVKPAQGAFDHPTESAQSASVTGTTPGQNWPDAPLTKRLSMRLRVITAITLHDLRSPLRPPGPAFDRWHGIKQVEQFGNVMAIGGRGRDRQWHAARPIRQKMVFCALFTPVRRIGPGLLPPKMARAVAESTTPRDQSILSWALSRASNAAKAFLKTPALCQSRRYRQQLMPLPHPSSCGRSFQAIPVLRTNSIPANARRGSIGLRPGCARRRFGGGGTNGSINCHKRFSTFGSAMVSPAASCNTLTIASLFHFVTAS